MEQCKLLFARLVRMLLGESAISERKLTSGESLVVLGILVPTRLCRCLRNEASGVMQVKPSASGVSFRLCPEETS